MRRTTSPDTAPPEPVLTREDILEMQALVRRVPAADSVIAHAVNLVRATRPETRGGPGDLQRFLSFGAGPRASQALILGAKARAVLDGRFAAEIDDVRSLALPILRHRLVLNFRADADGVRTDHLISELLNHVRP